MELTSNLCVIRLENNRFHSILNCEKYTEMANDRLKRRSRSKERRSRSRERRSRSRSKERRSRRSRSRDRKPDCHTSNATTSRDRRSRSAERIKRESQKVKNEKELKHGIKAEDEMEIDEIKPKKAEPLSLEELLEKKKSEEAARSKPVFITKEQRAAEAIKRRQEEVAAMRAAQASVPRFGDVPVTALLNKDRRERERDEKLERRERDRYVMK